MPRQSWRCAIDGLENDDHGLERYYSLALVVKMFTGHRVRLAGVPRLQLAVRIGPHLCSSVVVVVKSRTRAADRGSHVSGAVQSGTIFKAVIAYTLPSDFN